MGAYLITMILYYFLDLLFKLYTLRQQNKHYYAKYLRQQTN